MHIYGLDLPTTDLLSTFDDAIEFIDQGIKNGGTLESIFDPS